MNDAHMRDGSVIERASILNFRPTFPFPAAPFVREFNRSLSKAHYIHPS